MRSIDAPLRNDGASEKMQKKYASDADRQRAHRQRTKERLAGLQPPTPPRKPPRKLPRSKRLDVVIAELSAIQSECESWLDGLPANLEESALADQLREAIEQLQVAIDATEEVSPPLGFGR